MSVPDRPPSRNDALEVVDFIIAVLKEHEKELDRLINRLDDVGKALSRTISELDRKVEMLKQGADQLNLIAGGVERKLADLQGRTSYGVEAVEGFKRLQLTALKCRQWEDFRDLARQAKSVLFQANEPEKSLTVSALKDDKILIYSGELPGQTAMLKAWLSRQLEVPERDVVDGSLLI